MNSSITQTLAAILILISLVKTAMMLVNASAWIGFVKHYYKDTRVTSLVSLALAGIVLYLLIRSGLDIVQILAVCLFLFLLILVAVAPYVPRIYAWVETQDIALLIKQQWVYVTVWLALLFWGAFTLLAR